MACKRYPQALLALLLPAVRLSTATVAKLATVAAAAMAGSSVSHVLPALLVATLSMRCSEVLIFSRILTAPW